MPRTNTKAHREAEEAIKKPTPDDGSNSGGGNNGGGGSTLERVTVNLTPRSVAAMENLVASTGYSKTDVINRALQMYNHIQEVEAANGRIYTREQGSDELARLYFL